jgi:hypothetical protein
MMGRIARWTYEQIASAQEADRIEATRRQRESRNARAAARRAMRRGADGVQRQSHLYAVKP